MEADWAEANQFVIQASNADFPAQVTALAFDYLQELLWVGDNNGRLSSYIGPELTPYTAFRINEPGEGDVHQLLINDKGIIALGSKSVGMYIRRGIIQWEIRHEDMKDLHCMSFISKNNNEILVAGMQNTMFVIDVNKGELVRQVPTEHPYIMMKKARLLCAATTTGGVDLLDPTDFKVVKSWQAHGTIKDMDAQGEFVVTCGASAKQQGFMSDPFVNIFDLKNMVTITPLSFPAHAAYVRLHPKMLTTSIVLSQMGQLHVVDFLNPNTPNVRYAMAQYPNRLEIAPSGEAIAMVQNGSSIHLWGSPSKMIRFTDFSTPIELPDAPQPPPDLDWSNDTPLSAVGLPFYYGTELLLSAWPEDLVCDVGAPPVHLGKAFLDTLKKTEWGWYGPNSRGLLRNQFEDTRTQGKSTTALTPPKFLSERARESAMSAGLSAAAEVKAEAPDELGMESLKPSAPPMYRNLEIKYSKFGVDDFDFRFYNNTDFAGLENHISNCYANPLLQLMHYTPLLRNMALQHVATACLVDPCMLCELGFVFDMLKKAEGALATCHATNLLKALAKMPKAGKMGLLEDEARESRGGTPTMVMSLCRFLMDRVNEDYQTIPPASTALEQSLFDLSQPANLEELVYKLVASSMVLAIRCTNCKSEKLTPETATVIDMMYPQPNRPARGGRATRTTFSQALKLGVERETNNRAWCNHCNRYHPLQMRRIVQSVPAVLAINTAISSSDHRRLWATSGWLPEEIGIIVEQGQFFCFEGQDLQLHLQRGTFKILVYSLVGMVVSVDSAEHQKPHLVATVNVAHADPEPSPTGRWYLFNDFSVRSVLSKEALTFNATWKMPVVLMYQLKSANHKTASDWKTNLDTSVLYREPTSPPEYRTFQVLKEGVDAIGPGTLAALDAEFVSLKSPEIQMNSDGQMETIRPIAHAVARVSVVRGQGEQEGVPFIDDYIAIKEPVVDYLTKFSGVVAEDLDPSRSKHSLVSLKIVYKKLWVLLNLGCVFVGHGLKQDFRVINLHVPRAQVIDTIELYYLAERYRFRKLSLKWLAYNILKESVQQENHDSIEDARTALQLYKKFLEFKTARVWQKILEDTYKQGQMCNYKPPEGSWKPPEQGGSKPPDQGGLRKETPPIPADNAPGPSTPLRNTNGTPSQTPGSFGTPAFTPRGAGR